MLIKYEYPRGDIFIKTPCPNKDGTVMVGSIACGECECYLYKLPFITVVWCKGKRRK